MALFDDGNNHGQPVNQLYCLWCWCTGRLRDWELGVMLLLCVQWTFFHNKNNIRKFNTIWDLCCCYWCGPLLQWLLGNALKCFIFLFLLLCQVGKLNKQPPQQQQPRSYRWMVGQRSSQPTYQTIQLKPRLLCYSLFAGMEIFFDIKFTLEEPWTFWLCSTRERHTHEPRYMCTYLYTNTATDIKVLCGYWNGEGFLWCMRLRWWYY